MKTATILFNVSPSIETHIKSANTIDLLEGGKEHAQNVPNSEINCCDEDGKEGHADGSSRNVPIQTDSEGAKKMVDICEDGEEGNADDNSEEDDKMDDEEDEEESEEVESSSGEGSSSPVIVHPHLPPLPRRESKGKTSKKISCSSSESSYSSSSGSSSDSSDSSSGSSSDSSDSS